LLAVEVHGADVQDRDGAKGVLKRSRRRFPFIERVFADGGYAGRLVAWASDKTQILSANCSEAEKGSSSCTGIKQEGGQP
jgi:hypothetical protein